jgi:hypothetical protein
MEDPTADTNRGVAGGRGMKKFVVALAVLVAVLIPAGQAVAGSPHFVGTPTLTTSGTTADATGKVAGLGNEDAIFVEVIIEADCINGGSHHPKAANKESLAAAGLFPVQNGKADFEEFVTATFQPPCDPPMTLSFSLLSVKVFEGCDSVASCTDQFLVLSYP